MIEQMTQYQEQVQELANQVGKYIEGECKNAALSRRIRKASTELAKVSKDMRAATVEHHKSE